MVWLGGLALAGTLAAAPPCSEQDPTAARALLRALRFPLPLAQDRVPLAAPDDLPEDRPFTVRVGARLFRTDLEDVEEYATGTEVFALVAGGRVRREGSAVVQEVEVGGSTLRILVEGLVPDPALGEDPGPEAGGVVGRLAEQGPLPACTPDLAGLGYHPGPHLAVAVHGLFPDTPEGRRAFRRFAAARLLPALEQAPSVQPAPLPPRWPPPSERTLEGYARSRLAGRALGGGPAAEAGAGEARPTPPPGRARAPELGFFAVEEGGRRTRAPQEGPAFEACLDLLLEGLRWPLPDAEGLERFAGPDDLYGRPGPFPHRALDLGSRLVDAQGSFHVWPAGTPVFPLHRDLEGLHGVVEASAQGHVLRLRLQAFHTAPLQGQETPSGAVTTLAPIAGRWPLGGWRTSAPLLRVLGVPKGNHLHVVVDGLFQEDEESKARLLNGRVLAAWLAAPGPAAAAPHPPRPTPPPGEGAEERADPRGAAVLRAGQRLLARRFQALEPVAADGSPAGAEAVSLPALGTEPPWRLVLALPPGARLRPPLAGNPPTPQGDGDDLVQEASVEAAGRTFTLRILLRGCSPEGAGLRTVGGRLELDFTGAFPHGAAWLHCHVLPVLLPQDAR